MIDDMVKDALNTADMSDMYSARYDAVNTVWEDVFRAVIGVACCRINDALKTAGCLEYAGSAAKVRIYGEEDAEASSANPNARRANLAIVLLKGDRMVETSDELAFNLDDDIYDGMGRAQRMLEGLIRKIYSDATGNELSPAPFGLSLKTGIGNTWSEMIRVMTMRDDEAIARVRDAVGLTEEQLVAHIVNTNCDCTPCKAAAEIAKKWDKIKVSLPETSGVILKMFRGIVAGADLVTVGDMRALRESVGAGKINLPKIPEEVPDEHLIGNLRLLSACMAMMEVLN